MKKNLTICLMLIMSVLWSIETNAQSTGTGNAPGFNYFLGYNPATMPLIFGFGPGPTEYMRLTTSGWLGIGLTAPQSLVHLYNSYAANGEAYIQWTNTTTSNNLNSDGFKIGINNGGEGIINQQYDNADIKILLVHLKQVIY